MADDDGGLFPTKPCWRCGRPIIGTPVGGMIPPATPAGMWITADGVDLCLSCGGNGKNSLTPGEVLKLRQIRSPDRLGTPVPLPALPYPDPETGRTSGHSGSDTSADRAHHDDTTGKTSRRQRLIMALLRDADTRGMTWRELSGVTGQHHGQASGALSNLHKAGLVCRLVEVRGRSHVYVLPEHVAGRDTEPFGGKIKPTLEEAWWLGYDTGRENYDNDTPTCPYRGDTLL